MLEKLFICGIVGTVAVVLLGLLRRILGKRLHPAGMCLLWILVGLRFLIPAALPLPEIDRPEDFGIASAQSRMFFSVETAEEYRPGGTYADRLDAPESNSRISLRTVLSHLWITGIAVLTVWFFILGIRLRRACRTAWRDESLPWIPSEVKIMRVTGISSPMTCGVFNPVIFLTAEPMTPETEKAVLAHEVSHIRRHDSLLKLFTLTVAVVHWWNPAAWLYVRLCGRDMELACDKRAVELLTKDGNMQKTARDYAAMLFTLAQKEHGNPLSLSFGQSPVKERMRMLLDRKKTSLVLTILLLCVTAGTLVCCGPAEQKTGDRETAALLAQLDAEAAKNARLTEELKSRWDEMEELRGILQERTQQRNDLKSEKEQMEEKYRQLRREYREAEKELLQMEDPLPYLSLSAEYPATLRSTAEDTTVEELLTAMERERTQLSAAKGLLASVLEMRELTQDEYAYNNKRLDILSDQRMVLIENGEDESEEYIKLTQQWHAVWDVLCDIANKSYTYDYQIEDLEHYIAQSEGDLARFERILKQKQADRSGR